MVAEHREGSTYQMIPKRNCGNLGRGRLLAPIGVGEDRVAVAVVVVVVQVVVVVVVVVVTAAAAFVLVVARYEQ